MLPLRLGVTPQSPQQEQHPQGAVPASGPPPPLLSGLGCLAHARQHPRSLLPAATTAAPPAAGGSGPGLSRCSAGWRGPASGAAAPCTSTQAADVCPGGAALRTGLQYPLCACVCTAGTDNILLCPVLSYAPTPPPTHLHGTPSPSPSPQIRSAARGGSSKQSPAPARTEGLRVGSVWGIRGRGRRVSQAGPRESRMLPARHVMQGHIRARGPPEIGSRSRRGDRRRCHYNVTALQLPTAYLRGQQAAGAAGRQVCPPRRRHLRGVAPWGQ